MFDVHLGDQKRLHPGKLTWEPENDPTEKEHLPNLHDFGYPCEFSGV